MSDMNATVLLRMIDDLTGPAKKAGASVRGLIKDLERLKRLRMNASGLGRSMQGVVREARKASEATRKLRSDFSRPVSGNAFRPAINNINGVRTAANSASRAVEHLNRDLRRNAGAGRNNAGGVNRGGGSRARGGHGGGFFRRAAGVPMHLGSGIAHSFGHALAYQATEGVIEGVIASVHAGMEQAFDRQHTAAMLKMQGESKKDIAAAIAQSRSMARSLPQFTSAQHLESIAELRPALLGGLPEATKLAPMFQNIVGVLEAAKQGAGKGALAGIDTHGEALDLVRALEVKGVTQLGEQAMHSYADSITKAIVAFNGQISAKDFHAAFKFSKFAATNWSQDFSTQILPTLMNEMKASHNASASSTGVALKSMYQSIVGNKMTGPALDAFYKLGMYNKSDLTFDKKGHAMRANTGAHMKGYDLFMRDPYQFVQDVLLPQMKKSGINLNDKKAVAAKMSELFSNRNAEYIADILALQQQLLEKDRENVKKAMGMDGLKFLQETDPTTRMQVLAAAVKELLGALGDTSFDGAMRGMKGTIDWAHHLADSINKSPYMKALGSHFDAAVAGLFGQGLGRKGLSRGSDKNYYAAGRSLGNAWSSFTSQIGKMLRFWEEIGLITGAMKTLAAVLSLVSAGMQLVRTGLEGIRDVLKSNTLNDIVKSMAGATQDIAAKVMAAGNSLVEAISAIGRWLKDKISWAFPNDAHAGELSHSQMAKVDADRHVARALSAGGMAGLRANRPPPFGGISNPFGSKGAFGLSGVENVGSKVMQPITSAVQSATPMFAQAGQGAMAALASGLQSGSGQATASMTALMSSLAAIAGAGVTVPVNLDTAGAEAKLNALIAKAGSIGSGGGSKPQFSKGLHDLGQ